jgi:transcriptional regulator with XRE-family HTH domain
MWTPRSREDRLAQPLAIAIRLIRTRHGKSIEEFAAMLGCPPNSLAQYQLGRTRPGAGRLIRLLALAQGDDEAQPLLEALGTIGISAPDLIFTPIAPHVREEQVVTVGRV